MVDTINNVFREAIEIHNQMKNSAGMPKSVRPKIKAIAYYKVEYSKIDDEFTSCEVILRAGSFTRFDDMISFNIKWIIRKLWKKNRRRGTEYYSLASHNEVTGKSIKLELKAHDGDDFISGSFNYTTVRFLIIFKKDHFNIIVYEGRECDILGILGSF